MRAVGAEVAGAGGVVFPVVAGFGPEVDLDVVVIDLPGQNGAIGDGFEIEGSEEFG